MNKKGVVFSIMVTALLFSLFSFALLYKQIITEDLDQKADYLFVKRINSLETDISLDFLNLTGLVFSSIESNITIHNFTMENKQAYIQNYLEFLPLLFNLTNIPASVDLAPDFSIGDLNFSFNKTSFFVESFVGINSVYIEIMANESSLLNSSSFPLDSGVDTAIHVVIIRSNGTIALDSQVNLDTSVTNDQFIAYYGGENISVELSDEDLSIKTNINSSIQKLQIEFDVIPNEVKTGEYNISEYDLMSKNSYLRLFIP